MGHAFKPHLPVITEICYNNKPIKLNLIENLYLAKSSIRLFLDIVVLWAKCTMFSI